jgi:hypothetical protein
MKPGYELWKWGLIEVQRMDIRLVSLILLVASVLACRAEEPASGRWEGLVQIPDRELNLIIDLAQNDERAWIGSVIIPGLNVKGRPLTDIAVKDSEVSLAIKSSGRGLQAVFSADMNADGTLIGHFVQADNTAPFVLKRTGPPQVELPQRSTAVAKELEGEWKGEFELYGYPRHVTIKLVNRGAEGAVADFVIVGKKTTNVVVDLVTQEGDSLTIDSHEIGISYEGRFNKETSEIKGTFIQGAIELPLVLRRAQ